MLKNFATASWIRPATLSTTANPEIRPLRIPQPVKAAGNIQQNRSRRTELDKRTSERPNTRAGGSLGGFASGA
eukprot:8839783-Pyramimonas_sp.AAC.1